VRSPTDHPLLKVVGFAAVVGLIIGLAVAGASGGSGSDASPAATDATQTGSTTNTVTTASSHPVSVELETKKLVWVCLVDQDRRPVIDGLNLVAHQAVGPYGAKAFEVSFGNGSIELTLNGNPVDVPGIAAPLAYRITPEGATRLPPTAGPSCT
jgi:hypothetical protein